MRRQCLVVVALFAIGGCTQTPGLSPLGPSELPSSPGPFQPVPEILDLSDIDPCHWATRNGDTCSSSDGDHEIPMAGPTPVGED